MELIDVVKQVAPFLESWIDYQREFMHVPGVQVAVRVGDELGASFALGVSNAETGKKLTTRHLFHVASHSKTFTATAVMQLVEAGKLRLDDKAGTWLPELAGSPAAEYTVRELVGHQSGINRDGFDSDYWQLMAAFPDRERIIEFARADAILKTNEYFKYSNIGYSLLGMIIEAASGESYEDYVMGHIVKPLGLKHTGPEVPARRVKELAGAHGIRLHVDDPRPIIADTASHAEAAATGFYSTAEELTAYLVHHAFGRDELLSDDSKRLMQRRESRITRGGERFYGLGMAMCEIDGRMVVGHSGGWPGHITQSWLDPHTGLCVSVLTNCLGGPATPWATAIIGCIDMVMEAEAAGPATHPKGVDPASFVGRYAQMWGVTEIALLGTRLYDLSPEAQNLKVFATPLEIVDAKTLRAQAEDSYGATGEDTYVERTKGGRITSLRSGGATMWPIKDYEKRLRAESARALAAVQ